MKPDIRTAVRRVLTHLDTSPAHQSPKTADTPEPTRAQRFLHSSKDVLGLNRRSRTNAALLGFTVGLIATIFSIGLYAAMTTAPQGVQGIAGLVGAAILTALGLGYSRILPHTPRRLSYAVPLLTGLMVHGALHSTSLSLIAALVLCAVLLHERLALAVAIMAALTTPVVGLSIQLQGGLYLSSLLMVALPLIMMAVKLVGPELRSQFQDQRLLALLLLLTALLTFSDLGKNPVFPALLLLLSVALTFPLHLFDQLSHVTLRKRHVTPGGVDTHVTEKQ